MEAEMFRAVLMKTRFKNVYMLEPLFVSTPTEPLVRTLLLPAKNENNPNAKRSIKFGIQTSVDYERKNTQLQTRPCFDDRK